MTTIDSETEDASTYLDHHSEYFRENNYAIYSEFRERCPVLHSTAWDGFWLFLGYDAIADAAQDAELFGNGVEKAVPPLSPDPLIPIDIDPPLHGAYRRIVLPRFSPGAAQRWRPRIRQLATELVDDFIETGRADIRPAADHPTASALDSADVGSRRQPLVGMGALDPFQHSRPHPRP